MEENIDFNSIIAPNFTKYTDEEIERIYSSSSSDSFSSDSSVESYYKEPGNGDLMTYKLTMMSDIEFKRYFRMRKSTVQQLLDKFKADQNDDNKISDLSCDTQIYMTLSYLTSQESYKNLAKMYGVRMQVFWPTIDSTIQWIIRQPFINWPSHQEQQTTMENFESQTGVPFVIGAIGVTHIQFKPGNEDERYRKQNNYSIALQGVADHRSRFIDIHCGEPSGLDGYTILRKSRLYRNLYANSQAIKPQGFIVGNATYPSSNWMVSPFRRVNRSIREQKFDKIIVKPVKNITTAFATLRSRFQRIYESFDRGSVYYKLQHVEVLIQSVVACCLLHNFCVERDDHVDIVETDTYEIESGVSVNVDQGGRRQEIYKYLQNKSII